MQIGIKQAAHQTWHQLVQVTHVEMDPKGSGVADIRLAELVVGSINLRFVDKKTGEAKEEGATRPDIITRQLTTRPGQAG